MPKPLTRGNHVFCKDEDVESPKEKAKRLSKEGFSFCIDEESGETEYENETDTVFLDDVQNHTEVNNLTKEIAKEIVEEKKRKKELKETIRKMRNIRKRNRRRLRLLFSRKKKKKKNFQ